MCKIPYIDKDKLANQYRIFIGLNLEDKQGRVRAKWRRFQLAPASTYPLKCLYEPPKNMIIQALSYVNNNIY